MMRLSVCLLALFLSGCYFWGPPPVKPDLAFGDFYIAPTYRMGDLHVVPMKIVIKNLGNYAIKKKKEIEIEITGLHNPDWPFLDNNGNPVDKDGNPMKILGSSRVLFGAHVKPFAHDYLVIKALIYAKNSPKGDDFVEIVTSGYIDYPHGPGTLKGMARLDPQGKIGELNELNNEMEVSIQMSGR